MFIISAFVIGLVGSLHCMGMCGPIAFALPARTTNPWLKSIKYLVYNLGRISSYATLGLVAGFIGKGFAFAGLQQLLSILTGVLILVSVIVVSLPTQNLNSFTNKISLILRNAFRQFLKSGSYTSLLTLGILNGLLPCGMVYTALIASIATLEPLKGAGFMAAFGTGTIPIMMAISLSGSMFSLKGRHIFLKITPYVSCIIGILLILRGLNLGIPYISPLLEAGNKVSCH